MNFEDKLREKFGRFYDVQGPVVIGNMNFQFIAKFNQRNARYILKKTNEYYAFENNEFVLYKRLDGPINENIMTSIEQFFNDHAESLIQIDDEHMSSAVVLILETESEIDPALAGKIQKFKYYKSFMFGLKGWINGGLMLINPLDNKGLSNKYSKRELEKILS